MIPPLGDGEHDDDRGAPAYGDEDERRAAVAMWLATVSIIILFGSLAVRAAAAFDDARAEQRPCPGEVR